MVDAYGDNDYDSLWHIAEQVADCFAYSGYAFVEDDKIDGLAATLGSFLTVAGIPVNPPDIVDPAPDDEPFPSAMRGVHAISAAWQPQPR